MRQSYTRIFYILSLILLWMCAMSSRAQGENTPAQPPVIVSGIPVDGEFCYRDEMGNFAGFIPDVARVIFENAKIDYRLEKLRDDQMYKFNTDRDLKWALDRSDVFMLATRNNQLQSKYFYSAPYLSIEFSVLTRTDGNYEGPPSLQNSIVAVTQNQASAAIMMIITDPNRAESGGLDCELIAAPTVEEAFKVLDSGEVDYLVISKQEAVSYADVIRRYGFASFPSELLPLKISLASEDGDLIAKLNKSIRQLRINGTLHDLFSYHILGEKEKDDEVIALQTKINMIVFLVIIFVIAIVIGAFRLFLNDRRATRQRQSDAQQIKDLQEKLSLAFDAGGLSAWSYQRETDLFSVFYGDVILDPQRTLADREKSIHPKDRHLFRDAIQALYSREKATEKIAIRVLCDSEYRWMLFYMKSLDNAAGEVTNILGTRIDITDLKMRETTLELQNRKQLQLSNYINLMLGATNIIMWRIAYETGEMESLLGDSSELTVSSVDQFEEKFIPIGLRSMFRNKLRQLVEGEVSTITSTRCIKDPIAGPRYRRYTSMLGISGADGTHYILVAGQDVTDSILQEEQLRMNIVRNEMLMKGGGLVPWDFDVKTQLYDFMSNGSIKKQSDFIIDHLPKIVAEDREMVSGYYQRMINGEDASMTCEYSERRAERRQLKRVRTHAIPYERNGGGRVTRYIGYSKDITEETHLTESLKEALAMAKESDLMKSAFLANMSHEIRTPLNSIVGFSELIADEEDAEQRQEYFKYIAMNNEMLLTLINDILDLSKIEAGFKYLPKDTDFPEYFDRVATSLRSRLSNPDVEFIVDNPLDHLYVSIDPDRFAQVITNYTTNAIKHTNKGSIRLGYKYDKGVLEIFVRDTGGGIAPEVQCHLFQRFQKLDDHTQGTGLGLAIVKALMTQFGGDCGCESALGEGSYFWARVPINELHREE